MSYPNDDSEYDVDADGHPVSSPTDIPASESNLFPVDPSSDGHKDCSPKYAATEYEKTDSSAEVNGNYVKELASLRASKVEMDEKLKKLDTELENSNIKMNSLLLDKRLLEEEKCKLEIEAAALAKETTIIGQERAKLLAEKQSLVDEKEALESAVSESREEIRGLKIESQEAELVASAAASQINALNLEIEKLSDEQEKLAAEKEDLQAQISLSQNKFIQLQLENKSLEDELANLVDSAVAAELQTSVTYKIIEELQAEVVRLNEGKEKLDRELNVSLQRISSLEEHIRYLSSREQELEAQVEKLETDLEAAKYAHEADSSALGQERDSRGSLVNVLEAAHSKSRGLEKNLEVLQLSFLTVQGDALKYQQQISTLECQVSTLRDEKMSLEQAKSAIQMEVEKLNSVSEEAVSDVKCELAQRSKQVEILEMSLVKAKQEAVCSDQKVYQLKVELEFIRECLERKSKLAMLTLPVAAVSTSALVLVGIVAFLKHSKNQ